MPNLQKIISAGYLLEPGSEKEIEKLSEQQINFLANLKTKPLILTRKIIEGVANPKIKLIEKLLENTCSQIRPNNFVSA